MMAVQHQSIYRWVILLSCIYGKLFEILDEHAHQLLQSLNTTTESKKMEQLYITNTYLDSS